MQTPRARPTRAWWSDRPRWLRLPVLALVGLYLAYLLLANLFLNTPVGEWAANRKPDKFTIQWGPAVSWWPGYVKIWDVHLKGHVGHTRWEVHAARAQGHLSLWPLLQRQVRVPLVVAEQVTGGARRDPGPPTLPPPYRAGGWVLDFQRIESDSVRGGYFGDLKLEVAGTGKASGGFYKQLRGGAMELTPWHGELQHARIAGPRQVLLSDGALQVDFSIDRHRRDQAHGIDKLLKTDARLRLQGKTAALSLQRDARGHPVLRAAPGEGQATMDLHWLRGELQPGGKLEWRAPLVGKRLDGQALQGELTAQVRVAQDIQVHAQMPEQPGANLALDAELTVRGRRLPLHDFASLVPRANGHVQLQWRFPTLAWITEMFPQASWLKLQGEGLVDADVQVSEGQLAPGSRISVPQVQASAEVMGNHIEGMAEARLQVDGEAGALVPTLNLQMQRFVIAADDARARPFVEGNDLRLDLRAGAGERNVAGLRDTASAHLVFRNARVPDLRAYNRYLPAAHLRFEGGSGTLGGDLQVVPGGRIGQGTLQVVASGAKLHVAGMALRGDVRSDIRLKQADLKGQNFTLDASTLDLRNVSFTGSNGQAHTGWWAKLSLAQGRMDWTRPITVDGNLRINVRDLDFLLAMYAQQRDFPKWIGKIVDAGQAQVTGRVHWHDNLLVLDRVQAGNDRFTVLARLRLQDRQREGSLYANWGVLSAALETRGGQRNWHLIRARQWYDAQPDLLH
ncbi:MAG TPA: hypothetical protein VGC74_06955 [Stenotrophomonas sp.]|jgi:hypothetical protein